MAELTRKSLKQGCLGVAGLALLGLAGVAGWLWQRHQAAEAEALVAAEAHAEEVFAPALSALDAGEKAAPEAYDIDKTVRILHGLDQAIREQDSLEDYLMVMAREDYRGVAPEVLEARAELMELLMRLYATQTELGDQEAAWAFSSELLLSTMSVVQVEGSFNPVVPTGSLSIDRERAAALLADLKARQADKRALKHEITALETDLVRAMMRSSEAWYRHLEAWDRLSVQRDRAWLAAAVGDWVALEAAAEAAVEAAPHDREAHLLLALARIEGGSAEEDPATLDLLARFQEEHPESSAPALLLRGALAAKRGSPKDAQLALQQAAAYYPRQAESLTDMLDPYALRGYLRKSRDGNAILEQYKAMMLGAGYFSPDLQLARTAFETGHFEEGKTRVMDHFARRRAQGQWDFILSDVAFCQDLMGPWFREIFPEEAWLDLEVSPSTFGEKLNVSVHNRSDRALHNATLILVLHLTDMQPDDYETLTAERTLPAVNPHARTDFGSVEIAIPVLGSIKGVGDIVHHRAILVTNEAVLWVDTEAYRIAEDEAFHRQKTSSAVEQVPPPSYRRTADALVAAARERATLEIESRYGADHVLVTLPKELSILQPLIRLKYGDQVFSAADNLIEGDHIALRFTGVDNFDDEAHADNLELIVRSPYGDLVLEWTWEGALRYRLVAEGENPG